MSLVPLFEHCVVVPPTDVMVEGMWAVGVGGEVWQEPPTLLFVHLVDGRNEIGNVAERLHSVFI